MSDRRPLRSLRLCSWIVLLAAVLLPAQLGAALPKQEWAPREPALTGRLLIASPKIGDPRFWHTVILVVRHDKTGALGITINRPLGERPLAALLKGLGEKGVTSSRNVRLFAGGPVQPEIGFVVHSAEYDRQDTTHVNMEIGVTASPDILRDIAHSKGPRKSLIALGYAGWAAGQLEAELERDDWLLGAADPDLVFDLPRERVWDEAMTRRK